MAKPEAVAAAQMVYAALGNFKPHLLFAETLRYGRTQCCDVLGLRKRTARHLLTPD